MRLQHGVHSCSGAHFDGMALVESTFITSLNADQKKARHKKQRREELLERTDNGPNILKLHQDLQALAEDLDERVEAKLNANENAFFLAYKTHMFKVQQEFNELRQRADEEETKTRRDAKIQSLEKELDWFMNEALRLDELCKKYKTELDKWKGRAEALEDDRQFLENQIMTAKRNNKSLRNAVEKAQTSAYSTLVASSDEAGQNVSPTPGPAPELEQAPALDSTGSAGKLSQELELRYQTCVKRLQQQLETERKLAAKMRAVSDKQFSEPSDLEEFFLDCVEKVRHDIGERKKVGREENQRLKKGDRGAEKAKVKALHAGEAPFAAPNVALEEFTVADRRQVVELLLSSEPVLQFLYDKLFPVAGNSIGQLTDVPEF